MKRLAIYVYHDKTGVIGDYVLYFLNALQEIAQDIVVVLNGQIKITELEKFKNFKGRIIQRENKGYDFWGWREGIFSVGLEKLKEYDELILTNSSTFGPLFPFEDVFSKVKPADFWGMTSHAPTAKIKEHVQSYFMVFKNKMFTSKDFLHYFEKMKKVSGKKEAIGLEINFTEHFKKLGYSFETFIPSVVYKYGIDNPHQYLGDILAEEYLLPLIKKTAFGMRYDLACRETGGSSAVKILDFIKNKTNYDIKLITKEIARIYPMEEIQRFLHLNYALSDKYREGFSLPKCACMLDFPSLKSRFGELLECYEPDFKVSYFKQICDLAKKYEYILIFSPGAKIPSDYMQKTYIEHLLNCTVKNKVYLMNLINVFKNHPYIGVLAPIPYLFDGTKQMHTLPDKNEIEGFCQRMNVTVPVNFRFLNTISGCVWLKSETVNQIKDVIDFDYETKLNKGMIFSILAQKYGFLTGTIGNIPDMEDYAGKLQYFTFLRNEFLDDVALKIHRNTGKIL